MKLGRSQLTVLLNALFDTDTRSIPVKHPSGEVGELIRIDLGEADASNVAVTLDEKEYASKRADVNRTYGEPAVTELPEADDYVKAFLAGGLISVPNAEEIEDFLQTNGYPDLTAGHEPVVAGFDTNLLAWYPYSVLGLEPGAEAAVNGFIVVTGVFNELKWDQKRQNTEAIERAFGVEFGALWNQPAGKRRIGRLGETCYRQLRDHRYADEVVSDRGDEAIVQAVANYQTDSRKTALLFSNDRNFIERAEANRVRAQRVEFPRELPARVEGSWEAIGNTLYVLAVLFGVLVLPKVTLFGVWKGKGGQAWHDEMVKIDCRSPKVEEFLARDKKILDSVSS